MNEHEWQEVIGTIGLVLLVPTIIIVAIWQIAATVRAKAALAREKEYREHAERRLAALESRMDSVERILEDVE